MVLLWCLVLVAALGFSHTIERSLLEFIVKTKLGSYQGIQIAPLLGKNRSVHAFLGIPYGKAPTGLLRFDKPKPISAFHGVHKATHKPPSCYQHSFDLQFVWADKNSSMSEDCLFLNIWAPEETEAEKQLKPVMVWIHGGSYAAGSSAMELYDGQVISAIGEVIVVTFNYRLGVFGFLKSAQKDAPGNAGLYDSLLALRWIKDNIEYFGGDPNRVTLFGESAGAMSAGLLALSPLAQGLFHRIILQSGSPYVPVAENYSTQTEKATYLGNFVNCTNATITLTSNPGEVVACMRALPAKELFKSYYKTFGLMDKQLNYGFEPTFWDELIPSHPAESFLRENYTPYDVFVGVTKNEGSSLFTCVFPEEFDLFIKGLLPLTKDLATEMLIGFFKAVAFSYPEIPTKYYLKHIKEDPRALIEAMFEAIGDYYIVCPALFLAEKYSERCAKVHFYLFDHRPSTSPWPEWMGAAHFVDVEFVFGMPIRYPERYRKDEKRLSEYIIRTWANFAKSEDLKLMNGSPWPTFTRSNSAFATFHVDQQTIGHNVHKEACDFWRPYFAANNSCKYDSLVSLDGRCKAGIPSSNTCRKD